MEYERLRICSLEGEHWSVFLHEQQGYLGRCYVAAKREDLKDPFDMQSSEKTEFEHLGRRVRNIITDVLRPDRFNYAVLGNIWPRCHMHIIPRFKEERQMLGITFTDKRWGQNYAPYEKLELPIETLIGIKVELFESQPAFRL